MTSALVGIHNGRKASNGQASPEASPEQPATDGERRELHLGDLAIEGDWDTILAGRVTVEDQLEALEALRALAALPDRLRRDLSLRVGGFGYRGSPP